MEDKITEYLSTGKKRRLVPLLIVDNFPTMQE